MSNRPLTASLHTVTAVSRLAVHLHAAAGANGTQYQSSCRAAFYTADALEVLGYAAEQAQAVDAFQNPGAASDLIAKCIAATAKALS